jgi:predicted component of viral defense system (DUF524 family)
VRSTFDVPENRFVKAFIEQAIGIVEQIQVLAAGRGSSFAARIEADCGHMLQRLEPLLRTGLLAGVGQMRRLPAESMVLQRRRGYREVFRCFLRMRMATRIPTGADARDLLEVKDIAALYELEVLLRGAARRHADPRPTRGRTDARRHRPAALPPL